MLDRVNRYFGSYWFKRLVGDPVPATVSDLIAHDYPLPLIRPQGLPFVVFSYVGEFERDIQLTGWKPCPCVTGDKEMDEAMAIVRKTAARAGVTMDQAYAKKLDDEKCEAYLWIVLDPTNKKACMYAAGYIPK